jgi:cytochrome c-type biogenesis protein CcmH/NrfG
MKRTFFIVVWLVAAGVVLAASMELTSARLYKKQGEWAKSLQFYDDAIRKEPGLLEAYFERGEMLKEIASNPEHAALAAAVVTDKANPQGELYDRMLSDFRDAQTARNPGDDGTIKKLKKKIEQILQEQWAHFYFLAVQSDSAYSKAKEENSTDTDSYLQTAQKQLEMAIKLLPEKWNAYGLLAQIYGRMNDPGKSAENWRLAKEKIEASDMTKKDHENYLKAIEAIHANLLEKYYTLERYDDAILLADGILSGAPGNVDAIQFKAFSIAHKANDTTLTEDQRRQMKNDAITALNAARKEQPNEPVILYYIGQFHLQLADTAEALQAFEDYVKLDSTDREVRFALGVIYLEGGTFADNNRALDEFRQLVEKDSTDSASWINYGIALIRKGDNIKGKSAIEKGKSLK